MTGWLVFVFLIHLLALAALVPSCVSAHSDAPIGG